LELTPGVFPFNFFAIHVNGLGRQREVYIGVLLYNCTCVAVWRSKNGL